MERWFVSQIERISQDRKQGASQLYFQGVYILRRWLISSDSQANPDTLPLLVERLVGAQPSMAPLINLCNRVMMFVEKRDFRGAIAYLEKGLLNTESGIEFISQRLKPVLCGSKRIVLLSYSSTVIKVLLKCALKLPVLTHVGHPLGDGRRSAEVLADDGFEVSLTSDLCLPGMLQEEDLVLTGCDAILKSGVVNRTGTYPVALAASKRGVPLVVMCEEAKILSESLEFLHRIELASPKELGESSRYKVVHSYFEKVSCDLVYKVITEKREFSGNEIPDVVGSLHQVPSMFLPSR
jgi:translation initiation factor 2B subunit (eIF-2B alpha/beta/delta family)